MAKPSDSDDSFLGRWSRRKRAQSAQDAPELQDEVGPIVPPSPPVEEEVLRPEDLARLPSIDDLTPDSDIRAFLQKGVPKVLRNAALRRKWMLVPGIREHKDPAVDYAWDWNTPGGVPGDGHAPSPERAAQMLRDLIEPRCSPVPESADETVSDHDEAMPQNTAAIDVQVVDGAGRQTQIEPEPQSVRISAAPTKLPVAALDAVEMEDLMPVSRKRHGGALPG